VILYPEKKSTSFVGIWLHWQNSVYF